MAKVVADICFDVSAAAVIDVVFCCASIRCYNSCVAATAEYFYTDVAMDADDVILVLTLAVVNSCHFPGVVVVAAAAA